MYARIIRFSLESTPLLENMKSLVENFNAVLKRKTTKRKQNIDVIADIATNHIRPSPNISTISGFAWRCKDFTHALHVRLQNSQFFRKISLALTVRAFFSGPLLR